MENKEKAEFILRSLGFNKDIDPKAYSQGLEEILNSFDFFKKAEEPFSFFENPIEDLNKEKSKEVKFEEVAYDFMERLATNKGKFIAAKFIFDIENHFRKNNTLNESEAIALYKDTIEAYK